MPKTFEDVEATSVTWFVQVNLESHFTPRYEWLDTVDSGWPKKASTCVLCGLGLILFVIGRWTHLDTLNSICHLSDHVWRWLRAVWRISWSVLEEML